jgi:hypothetical protein
MPPSQQVEPCSLEEREIDLLARGPHLRETLGIPVAAEQFEAIGEVVALRVFNCQLLEGRN